MRISDFNVMGMDFVNNMNRASQMANISAQKLSTGYRVNTAADDPISMLRIDRQEAQIRSIQAAQKNIQDGISLTQVMDQAISSLQNNGQELRELAVRYNSDTLSNNDRVLIEGKTEQILNEMRHTINTTTFNGINVFDRDSFTFQTGANTNDTITINVPKLQELQIIINNNIEAGRIDNNNASSTAITKNITPNNTSSYKTDNNTSSNIQDISTKHAKTNSKKSANKNTKKNNISNNYPNESSFISENPSTIFCTCNKEISANTSINNNPNIQRILNPDFIDTNILQPIAKYRSYIGVMQNILEDRLDFQRTRERQETSSLSDIRDVDFAKEMLELTRQQLLATINLQLFRDFREDQKQYIFGLLF